jgi:4'-phosphopantetheinyl transferase
VGVALTRLILAAHLNIGPADVPIDRSCPRCGEPHGRPRLATGAALDFSVSHSDDLIVVAITPKPSGGSSMRLVGVDVERITALSEPTLPDVVLSPAERMAFSQLDAATQRIALFRYWVRKEAILKATGHGLLVPLTHLTVSAADQLPRLREWTGGPLPETVKMYDLEADHRYAASLALVGDDAAVMELDAAHVLQR